MRSRQDIEAYLTRSGHPHRVLAEDTWLVSDPSESRDHVVVRLAEGLVIFRMKVLPTDRVDPKRREEFLETLLRLNAEDMVHGAYGISGSDVLVVATLQLAQLDYEEFSGVLDELSVAVIRHYPELRDFLADAA